MNTHRRSPKTSAWLLAGAAGAALLGMSGAAHGQFVNGQAASKVLGQPDFTSSAPAVSRRGEFVPEKVLFDHLGNMWLSDGCNSRILEYKRPFTTDMPASLVIGAANFTTNNTPGCGAPVMPTTGANFNQTFGFALSPYGDMWVTDGLDNRVLIFSQPFSNGMSASGVIGQPDFTSNAPGGGRTGFQLPLDIAFDLSGDAWVADADHNRVVELNGNPANIVLVIGQANFNATACRTTQSGLCFPASLAFDYLGDLWVMDYNNNRILEYRPPLHTGMNASVVLGQKDFVSSAPAAGQAGLNLNLHGNFFGGISFGERGELWVSDAANNRVLKFKPPYVTGMNASLVLGQDTFRTIAPATTAHGMWFPGFPAIDFSDNLWVADQNNNRVLEFKPGGGK